MIANKYLGQWRENPGWNYAGMAQQLRTDTNVDALIWQYYRARTKAKELIQGSIQDQYSKLWEYCAEVIERLKLESSIYHPEYSGDFHYQVRGPGDDQYIVDIEKKTCACNMWQLIGIPCIHGISVLLSSNCDPIDCIHNKYKKENFIKAYALVIYGINGPMMWPKTNDM
ncbi:hypothetical protein LWI28_003081 [Acer negundo]|uniref:SWIM-type domain-containing protein n=1 Tax=Acer negundo TaxID=4023 RepID=A0AAD5NRD8_ACENE|nr:hypothetical protein LWI28_003081 [Acer negundo]